MRCHLADSEEPPFGGDVESREYVTGAAIRALIAYNSLSNAFFPLEIAWSDRSRYANWARRLTYGTILAGAVALAFLVYETRSLITQITNVTWLSSAITVVLAGIGAIASVLGIIDFLSKRAQD